jgi:hypothetical protein
LLIVWRRLSALIVLFSCGVAAIVFAVIASDVTWKAVCIGVASTAFASALVDFSALWEVRARERVLLRVVGDRVGRIHQRMLWIVGTVFDVSMASAGDVCCELRAWKGSAINLADEKAAVFPPRSKQAWLAQCVADIDQSLEVALSIGAQTEAAPRVERLDTALRSSPFASWARDVAPTAALAGGGDMLAGQAADVLDVVQKEFRFFADRGGEQWRFGKL